MIARNYTDVQNALFTRTPFTHRSISAVTESNGDYVVYSYSTVVAKMTSEGPWLTDRKYSTTTSKHMGYIRRSWGV